MRNIRFSKLLLLVLAQIILVSCTESNSSKLTSVVKTSVGSIQGVIRTYSVPDAAKRSSSDVSTYTVNEYRGIPYALPPIGDRRWALPEPVASLGSGVFNAKDFGTPCPQNARAGSPESYSNEDCLSINVTTPSDIKPGEKLPVFFWIHGGAFVGGSSNLYRLDKLAHDGRMIVVSSNYRLGAFGFVPNKSFSSNKIYSKYWSNDNNVSSRMVFKYSKKNKYLFWYSKRATIGCPFFVSFEW